MGVAYPSATKVPLAAVAAAYQGLIRRLLPRGVAWSWTDRLAGLALALGDELARVHNRILDLLEEMDPRYTDELLDAWERNVGVPFNADAPPVNDPQRRRNLHAWLTAVGGQTAEYFEALALRMGYSMTVTDGPGDYEFTCSVVQDFTGFECGYSECGDELGYMGARFLERLINRLKPAHTWAWFWYVGS